MKVWILRGFAASRIIREVEDDGYAWNNVSLSLADPALAASIRFECMESHYLLADLSPCSFDMQCRVWNGLPGYLQKKDYSLPENHRDTALKVAFRE